KEYYISVSPQWWCIASNDDQLGFALTKGLQGLLITKNIFTRFHDKSQSGIDALLSLFLNQRAKKFY
ncbi:hypothetical protein X777_14543, partial [Ooceraea biroi]